MARAIWSGAISFGLVNVPVKLYTATSPKTVRFHQLSAKTGARIRQKRVDSSTGEEVPFEHTWAGVMGASPNRGHSFGEIEENLFTAAGYTGGGIAMGTTAGMLLADLALGLKSKPLADMLALPTPTWLPPQPFLDVGIRLRVARMNASAGPAL